jgi:hypothetical protein
MENLYPNSMKLFIFLLICVQAWPVAAEKDNGKRQVTDKNKPSITEQRTAETCTLEIVSDSTCPSGEAVYKICRRNRRVTREIDMGCKENF